MTMTTSGLERRLVAVLLVVCLVSVVNAVLQDEKPPLEALTGSIRVRGQTL